MAGEEPEYESYDPVLQRSKREPEGPTKLVDEDGEPLPEFDDRYAEEFQGLLYIGALTRRFNWLGHEFLIRSLSVDDTLAIAEVVRPWADTVAQSRAYTTAVAALAVESIDGKDLPVPVGEDSNSYAWAFQRFNYAKANWYTYTVDKIYSEHLELEAKVAKVVAAMEKASGPGTDSSIPGSNPASVEPNAEAL